MALGFFESSSDPAAPDSYDAIQRKRKLADALMAQGQSDAPIQSWTQGLARVLQSGIGGYKNAKLDEQESASSKAFNDGLVKALGGVGDPAPASAPMPDAIPSPQAPSPQPGGSNMSIGPVGQGGSPDKDAFVAAMMPHALEVSKQTGIDPRIVIAQAGLESGWGQKAPGNNYFGIKSHGAPGGQTLATTENVNGQNVSTSDSFRQYGGMGDSAKGYADFMQSNPRYQPMMQAQGLDAQIAALGKSGYATDPQYGQKIASIAQGLPAPGANPQVAGNGPMAYAPQPPMGGGAPQQAPSPTPSQLVTALQAPTPSQGAPQVAPTPDRARELMVMALNPALSPAQRQQAMSVATMLQGQNKPIYQKSDDGTILQMNPLGGGPPKVVYQSGGKPTDTIKNYEAAKKEGYTGSLMDYQMGLKKAGATNVSVDQKTEGAFDQKIAGKQAELFSSVAEEGLTAKSDLANVAALREQMGKLPGGFIGGAQAMAKSYGINIGPNTSNLEAANAIISKLVPAQRQGMPGAASDRDVQMFRDSLPKLSNTPEGNKTILDTMEALGQYKAAQGEIANRVMTGQLNRNEGMKQLQALPDPMSAFRAAQGRVPTLPKTTAAPAPSQQQYSPDDIAAEMKRRGIN